MFLCFKVIAYSNVSIVTLKLSWVEQELLSTRIVSPLISVVFAIFGLISGRLVHTNDSISDTYHRIPPKTLLTEKAMVNVGQTQTRARVQETRVLFWIVFGLFHPGSVLLYPQVCGSQQENAWTMI